MIESEGNAGEALSKLEKKKLRNSTEPMSQVKEN